MRDYKSGSPVQVSRSPFRVQIQCPPSGLKPSLHCPACTISLSDDLPSLDRQRNHRRGLHITWQGLHGSTRRLRSQRRHASPQVCRVYEPPPPHPPPPPPPQPPPPPPPARTTSDAENQLLVPAVATVHIPHPPEPPPPPHPPPAAAEQAPAPAAHAEDPEPVARSLSETSRKYFRTIALTCRASTRSAVSASSTSDSGSTSSCSFDVNFDPSARTSHQRTSLHVLTIHTVRVLLVQTPPDDPNADDTTGTGDAPVRVDAAAAIPTVVVG